MYFIEVTKKSFDLAGVVQTEFRLQIWIPHKILSYKHVRHVILLFPTLSLTKPWTSYQSLLIWPSIYPFMKFHFCISFSETVVWHATHQNDRLGEAFLMGPIPEHFDPIWPNLRSLWPYLDYCEICYWNNFQKFFMF